MGFFYFTVMQNQRFYYHTGINVLQGHEKVLWDMQDMMVNSFVTWHYTITEEHTEKNSEEPNWNVDEHDNLQACL